MGTKSGYVQLWFALVLSALLLSSCGQYNLLDGQVVALQPQSTLRGIQSAMAGEAGTVILKNGDKLFFAWPQSIGEATKGYGFACVQCEAVLSNSPAAILKSIGGKGNVSNVKTLGDLAQYLKDNGWTVGAPILAKGQTIATWFNNVAAYTITIMIIPAGALPTEDPNT